LPADIRLIKANNLLVNGSLLLGKEGIWISVGGGPYLRSSNMVFQGFTVETGKGIGVVLQTGPRTVLARSANQATTLTAFEARWVGFVLAMWILGCFIELMLHGKGILLTRNSFV
jgi:magnesium-transporting ATPase (P-type)